MAPMNLTNNQIDDLLAALGRGPYYGEPDAGEINQGLRQTVRTWLADVTTEDDNAYITEPDRT